MNFSVKVFTNGKLIWELRTHKIRRFLKKLRSIKWSNAEIKVYLKVNYGTSLDCWGRYINFYNDGEYENKEDLLYMFYAFTED